MLKSHSSKTRFLTTSLLTTSCAFFLLTGGAVSRAQAADSIDYLYVSPAGSDSWTGQSPTPEGGSGPFQTLAHARDAVSALADPAFARPVEVLVAPGVCPPQESLGLWFSAVPQFPVIWHSDPARTVLIYTRTAAEQIDALSAEDYAPAGGERTVRFYVSPGGSDDWKGLTPAADADNGPFLTLERAQEAVRQFQSERPESPVEVVFEKNAPAAITAKKSLKPKTVIDPSKYTPAGLAALRVLSAPQSGGASKKTVFRNTSPGGGGADALGASAVRKTAATAAQGGHLVFAHYMVSNRDYGGSIAGYEKEIQQAQAAGIDGFALNCGSWNDAFYKHDTATIFQAAAALGTGFKLFFSADMTGLQFSEVTAMMKSYANHPNYWQVTPAGPPGTLPRPVLSTWGGEGGGFAAAKSNWQNGTLNPLKAAGITPYFMPFFFMTNAAGTQGEDNTKGPVDTEIKGLLLGLADGSFYAPAVGCPVDPSRTMLNNAETQAAQMKAAGLGTMGSVTPQYWGSRQVSLGRRYMEYDGGEGLAAQWASIINVQKPDWVELFTWNDWDEATYFSPIDDVNKYWPYAAHSALGFYKTHAGALKMNQYFVNWYKAGQKPAITKDSLYFFYRTHPKDAVATNDKVGPVSWRLGDPQDVLYVSTLLTAPATLAVTTGAKTLTYPVGAGLSHVRVPFSVGAQGFKLIRSGQTVLSQSGDPIVAAPAEYNFSYTTGSAGG